MPNVNPGPGINTTPTLQGALDALGPTNSTLFASLPPASSVPVGTPAYTSDMGWVYSNGLIWTPYSSAGGVGVSITGNTAGVPGLISSGTAIFAGGNNITLSQNGQSITISGANAGGAQTGISGIADAAGTQSNGTVSFANSNGVTFGLSTGALTGTITASVSQSVQTQAAGNIGGTGFATTTIAGVLLAGTNNTAGVTLAVPPYITGFTQSAFVLSNSNGLAFGTNGSTVTGSYTVPNTAGLISGINVSGGAGNSQSNVTGLTFSNLNGLTFGVSTGANVITITGSYTVPTQTNQSAIRGLGASNTGNTAGNTGISTGIDWVFAGTNNVTVSESTAAGGPNTLWISGPTVGGAQTGISGIVVSNTTYTSGTVSFSNANGISFGSSAGQAITASYTVPATAGLISGLNISGGAGNSQSAVSGITFSNNNGITFGVSTGANLATVTASYTVPSIAGLISAINVSDSATSENITQLIFSNNHGVTFGLSTAGGGPFATITASVSQSVQTQNCVDVSLSGNNTAGVLALISSGTVYLAGGNNITISQNANSLTISGANAGGAQTAISGIADAAGTQTIGTVSFANSNGVTFGLSTGANTATMTASVAAQSNQTVGIYASSNTTGSASSATYDARSVTVVGAGIVSVGNASTSAGGTTTGIFISATQSNQAVSAQGGSSAFQTLVFTNSNNVSFSNTGGSVWGSYALNVSAGGGTSNALSAITFTNSNGVTFGLSTGAGVGTMSASINSTSAVGLNTAKTNVTWTVNSSGISLNAAGYAGTGFTTASTLRAGFTGTLNTAGLSLAMPYQTRYIYPIGNLTKNGAPGNASASFQYVPVFNPVTGTRIDALMEIIAATAATTATMGIAYSAYAVIYTQNASTLSSLSSGSTQTTYTYASNTAGNTQLTVSGTAAGYRPISVPVNFNMVPGEYIVGFNFITNTTSVGLSTTALGVTWSMMGGANLQTLANYAEFTANTATSSNLFAGMGVYASATTGMPAAANFSDIVQTGNSFGQANIALVFRNA